jgi:uncharacterized protein (DUF924 family)
MDDCDRDTILKTWFPNDKYNKLWFSASEDDDNRITEKFSEILKKYERVSYVCKDEDECIASIILFDQLSRHIHRKTDLHKNDFRALKHALHYVPSEKTDPKHLIFSLMPFRHHGTIDDYNHVISKITEYEMIHPNSKHLQRFKRVTLTKKNEIIHKS